MGGDRLVECPTSTPRTRVRFPGAAREFSSKVRFQWRRSYGVYTPPCAIACINNVCAHCKDLEVRVRVRWIMETLEHPACTVGWVAQLCRSWFSPGKANPKFPMEEIPMEQYSCKKGKKKTKIYFKKREIMARVWGREGERVEDHCLGHHRSTTDIGLI